MEKQTDFQEKTRVSEAFAICRVLAILSVIVAHTPFPVEAGSVADELLTALGSIGVVMFFVISGYYFNPEKYGTLRAFFKPRLVTLVVPWLFVGSLIYVESALVSGQGLSFLSYGRFLVGHGSYLYYLPVLLVCFLVYFYPVKKGKIHLTCAISVALTVLSLQLTAFGVLDATRIGLTDYLNVFNWIGYFCIGVWLKRANVYRLMAWCRRFLWVLLPAYAGILALSFFVIGDRIGYFSYLGMPLQLIGVMIVMGICSWRWMNNRVFRYVSRASFGVYLVHMFTFAVVDKFVGTVPVVCFAAPLITLTVTTFGFWLLDLLARKIKFMKWVLPLVGMR